MPTDRRAARAKVLTTNLPPPPSTTYPAGSTIARFSVPGRPVPWSVPPKLRRKAPRLKAWQRTVNLAARLAMGNRPPHDGPVRLFLVFCLARPNERRLPDSTNLQKGVEDALQLTTYLNDTQVAAVECVRVVVADASKEGVGIVVQAYGPAGEPAEIEET
jgi:Holliday junction resolvase RusA-like endonuclease